MSSSSSANATGLPDRRHFLSTIAGAGALGLPVLPAMAWTPGPIEAMWPDYLRAEAAFDAVGSRVMDAEELYYEEPARPVWHPIRSEGGYEIVATTRGRGIAYLDNGPENVAYLEALAAEVHDPDDNSLGYHCTARAKTTLDAIRDWQAEVDRRRKAAGQNEAEGAEAAAVTAQAAQVDAIFAIEATTIRELAFQAAILDVDWHQARAERVLERLVELAGVTPYQAA